MFRLLRRLFSRSAPASPQPQGALTPPPPPPPRRIVSGDRSAPRERRRLRLIHGGGATVPREDPAAVPEQVEPSSGPLDEAPRPSVHLVFGDGSSEEVVESTPGGVRIRYLADNLLPGSEPGDPSASS
jgi:hypothetical protein